MATSVPAGDPGLSQNAGQAQSQWQQRPQKTVQFQGLTDAASTAGQAPNPNSPGAASGAATSPDPDFALRPPRPQQASTRLNRVGSDDDHTKQWMRDREFTPGQVDFAFGPRPQAPAAGSGGQRAPFGHFMNAVTGLAGNLPGGSGASLPPPYNPPAAPAPAPQIQPGPNWQPGQQPPPPNPVDTRQPPPGAPPYLPTPKPTPPGFAPPQPSEGRGDSYAKRYFAEQEAERERAGNLT